MSTNLIFLDSTTLTGNIQSDNFIVPLDIDISDCRYEISLVKLNLWYSWYNISSEYNNQTLRYSSNRGSTWKTITIPEGQYSIDQLNTLIQSIMYTNGDYYTNAQNIISYNITISLEYSTLKVNIQVSNNFQVDLTISNLYLLLGFSNIIVTTTQEGYLPANINNDINTLNLTCSIITGSYQNTNSSNILYTFTPNSLPGSNLDIYPQKLLYLPVVNIRRITSIGISIIDNLNRRVNLNNQPLSVLLSLRKIKSYNTIK